MKRLVRVVGESMAPTYRSSDRPGEQQVGRTVGGGHGLADHPDEALHVGVLVLVAVAVRTVDEVLVPVVLVVLTLGVLEEADVGGEVAAADEAIAQGSDSDLLPMVPQERRAELDKRFHAVLAIKDFDVDDVAAGRRYLAAYVSFFKYAEGED